MLTRELPTSETKIPRIIIYSGKGGTGKTTISSATATALAKEGKRVLILSSDPAHSLSDVYNFKIGRQEPLKIAENLYGLEIDTIYELKKHMSGFQKFVADSYLKRGVDSGVASELTTQPGLDEIFSLSRLVDEAHSGKWDAIILDTSPTGNTLRLLAYPEIIIGGNMGKQFFKLYKNMASLQRSLGGSNTPDPEFFDEVNLLMKQMEDINKFILRPEVTFRLVLNPEKLSILETKRAYTFVHLYGINIDCIVANKVLPTSNTVGDYFEFWSDLHRKYLLEIDNSFYPTPIFRCELQRTEPIGVEELSRVSKMVFKDQSPDKIFHAGKNFWIESKKDNVAELNREILCINIPFLGDAEEVSVKRMGTDISVTVDRIQRLITLPRVLYTLEMEKYIREKNTLRVLFKEVPREKEEENTERSATLSKLRASRQVRA